MSTSDPNRPADDTTAPATGEGAAAAPDADAPTASRVAGREAAVEATVVQPEAADTPSASRSEPIAGPSTTAPTEVQPAVVEKPADPVEKPTDPVVEKPTAPVVAAPVAETPEPVSLDTGRHAVVRPAPVPPEDPAPTTPVAVAGTPPTSTLVDPPTAAVPAASTSQAPEPVASYGAITPEPEADGRLFPDPNAPSSPSAGSRVLGILVGLILAPIAVAVLLLGESQILEAQVDGWDATTSVFGIVLVTLGLLLLGCVLLLGAWTAAVPITGGAVLTAAGAVYLYAPSIARDQTLNLLTSSGWRLTITQVTVAGTSGMVLAVGFLLLLAGIVIASARKRGVHLGEFRERHKV
jgi:hypothetical protein